jgi:hypothetical protein
VRRSVILICRQPSSGANGMKALATPRDNQIENSASIRMRMPLLA